MSFPSPDILDLSPTILDLDVKIAKGGGWTVGLKVTDAAGANVDLTGITAKVVLPDGSVWTATTGTSVFTWDIPKATVDALTFKSGVVMLTVSDASHTTVWAKGNVAVI